MKASILSILIISSLLGVGVFGFLGVGIMDHSEQSPCLISLMLGGSCPSIGNVLAIVSHHVSGLQYFTTFIISPDISLLFLSVFIVFTFLIFLGLPKEASSPQLLPHQTYAGFTESNLALKRQFLRWLALRHKRDPHAPCWVYEVA